MGARGGARTIIGSMIMRIEEITIEKAVALSDTELYNMRLRAVQIWDKHFAKTATPSSGTIMRSELLGQYEVINT